MIQENSSDANITSGLASTNFSIEVNESMFSMLTSKVYNDPMSAVIREWSTNALDACTEANLPLNFDVHMPTIAEPVFSVRDYGTGLPEEDITGLFATLGASTKRGSNAYNGTFGIGRMSGLAYAKAFTIESYYNGKYYSYIVSTDTGVPVSLKLSESTTTKANGLKLSVNVDHTDIHYFTEKATAIYRYFGTKPSLNVDLDIEDAQNTFAADDWFIDSRLGHHGNNYVLMSNVIYRIPDDNQIDNQNFSSLVIKVPTGSVAINPGRESLSLDKATIDFLNGKFAQIRKDFITTTKVIVNKHTTPVAQIEAFTEAYDAAPYGIKDDLRSKYHSIVPTNDLTPVVSSNYRGLEITSHLSDMEIKVKTSYYQTLRSVETYPLSLSKLSTYSICLIDKATNFQAAVKANVTSNTIVLQRPSGVDIKIFVPRAKLILANLGITDYACISEYPEAIDPPKNATQRADGLYVYSAREAGLCNQYKTKLDTKYWYITSTRTVPDIDYYKSMYAAYSLIPNPKSALVGIGKKYQDAASKLSDFIPAHDAIQEALDKLSFTEASNKTSNLYMGAALTAAKAPQDVLTLFSEYKTLKTKKDVISDTTSTLVKTKFNLNTTLFEYTHDLEHFYAKYPLFNDLCCSYRQKLFNHYLTLEYHYATIPANKR